MYLLIADTNDFFFISSANEKHDYMMSFYEENGDDYPASLSDDQKQTCLQLYDFLCSAGTVFDLTKIWPTFVFLVEVYNKQKKKSRKPVC
jgi:hypothetical protein